MFWRGSLHPCSVLVVADVNEFGAGLITPSLVWYFGVVLLVLFVRVLVLVVVVGVGLFVRQELPKEMLNGFQPKKEHLLKDYLIQELLLEVLLLFRQLD